MKHELPPLPYAYDALEPYISKQIMEVHHDKHHATYVAKLNEVVEATPEIQGMTIEQILMNTGKIPERARQAAINHGGGHYNHSFFWTIMKKNENGEAVGELGSAINDQFGGYGAFREKFTSIANSIFGSGWTWLVRDSSGKLSIIGTANQDSPLSLGFVPLVALDEWEHAYYLSYQNRRQEYVDAFWNVINWEEANRRFASK